MTWEETVLTDTEKIAITDMVCKKYKIKWADMVDGKLSPRDLEQFVIDVYDNTAKAQAKPSFEAGEQAERERIEKKIQAIYTQSRHSDHFVDLMQQEGWLG